MTALGISTALVLAMTGCFADHISTGGSPGGDPGWNQPPTGSGSNVPPSVRGRQTMSDVHVEPGGDRVWIVHSAVVDTSAQPAVTTAHLGVFVPETREFAEVIDTSGTLGKRILFPGTGRVLYVTQRGTGTDVFVSIDAVARRPLAQRSYPGNRGNFRVSPSGRAVIATDDSDGRLHLLGTESLFDQALPDVALPDAAEWVPGEDILYTLAFANGATQLWRRDLRTADLGALVPSPVLVATLRGLGSHVSVALDARHAAVSLLGSPQQVGLVDLTTGAVTVVDGDGESGFANDGRAVVWRRLANARHDFRLVDPVTGAASAAVATDLQFPVAQPLREHDALLVASLVFEQAPFVYHLADGAQVPLPEADLRSSLFERPGHDELWMWFELTDTLVRYDIVTGAQHDELQGVDSVDFRPDRDDLVYNTFDHSIGRLAMATGQDIGAPVMVADPNDAPAPYKLDDR